MERCSRTNINPDLIKERKKASFDVDKLTYILDGGENFTKRRQEIESLILKESFIRNQEDYHFMTREERYSNVVKKVEFYVKKRQELKLDAPYTYYLSEIIFPNEPKPISLTESMFPHAIEYQGSDEQAARWLPKCRNYQILGTYAQTELGHGTHVRNLETTATYELEREQFVLHSPTVTSTKFWPGGLGKTMNHAIVVAQLIIGGKRYGVHPFFVQLRDIDTHRPLPGIELGDIGPKFGYDTVDNGFMRFDNHRIPRENLLMRYQEVTKDGKYIKKAGSEKLMYGAMLYTRVYIVSNPATRYLAEAVTIATRYSCVRHQSELKPGDPEPAVIEFQTQRLKLLPQLAAAYALSFAARRIRTDYERIFANIKRGQTDELPELHATSSGLKAVAAYMSMNGVERCRLACGGHGYSQSSGLPKLYVDAVTPVTYEGESTVLLLQTAKYLVKMYQRSQTGEVLSATTKYLSRQPTKCNIDRTPSPASLMQAYEYKAYWLVSQVAKRLQKLAASGMAAHDSWNQSGVALVKAAEAHVQLYILESFLTGISNISDPSINAVLTDLFKLYACHAIADDSTAFLVDGYMSAAQVELISEAVLSGLDKVRPNAVALVDSFDFADRHLGSVLGRYDGNVYENLLDWAKRSPLNKVEVHPSFQHLKNLQQTFAKL